MVVGIRQTSREISTVTLGASPLPLAAKQAIEPGDVATETLVLMDRWLSALIDDVRADLDDAGYRFADVAVVAGRQVRDTVMAGASGAGIAIVAESVADRTGIAVRRRFDSALPALDPYVELVVYRVAQESLTNAAKHSGAGEISLTLSPRPLGLMLGYQDDDERTSEAMRDGHYHTGDVASRDEEGYITYVGRADDVFKASDYRISPFELESVLIEHEAVAEAAVVPSPDPLRLAVPKAFLVLAAGYEPDGDTARSILAFCRTRLAPYKRIRRLEFADLPKTISGKIRRVELRGAEHDRGGVASRNPGEFWEEDFPELRES